MLQSYKLWRATCGFLGTLRRAGSAYGFTDQTPNELPNDQHSLGGWMQYGTRYSDESGNTTKIEGVDNSFSNDNASKIIQGVPRVDDKIEE